MFIHSSLCIRLNWPLVGSLMNLERMVARKSFVMSGEDGMVRVSECHYLSYEQIFQYVKEVITG